MLDGDSGYSSAGSIDSYSRINARTYYGTSFTSQKTGNNDYQFEASWTDTSDTDNAEHLAPVWRVYPHGENKIFPLFMTDQGAGGIPALLVTSTLPAVTTAPNYGATPSPITPVATPYRTIPSRNVRTSPIVEPQAQAAPSPVDPVAQRLIMEAQKKQAEREGRPFPPLPPIPGQP